jgi:MEDS: MEthanogen/methylotroph, DcmR Sensory domain
VSDGVAASHHPDLSEQGSKTFQHLALLYAGEAEYLSGTVPFIHEGLGAGEAVLVAVDRASMELLQGGLGSAAGSVSWIDMGAVGGNPARIIPLWRKFVALHGAAGPIRGIGEPIWPGRTPDELVEAHRHEALLNLAFSDTPEFRLLCPYNVHGLHPSVIEEARRNHPLIVQAGTERRSVDYQPIDGDVGSDALPPPPRRRVKELALDGASSVAILGYVSPTAALVALSEARREDLLLAVLAVATSLRRASLRIWEERPTVVCEIRSERRIPDPLAGREWPPTDEAHGRGLWVANQLCELVQLRSSRSGTVVRLRVTDTPDGRPARIS